MRTRLIVLSTLAAILVLTVSAYADPIFPITINGVTFNDKNCGNCGETNILFGHPQQGPNLTIAGTTTTSHGAVPIDFLSPTLIYANGGQSDIDPCTAGGCMFPVTNGMITKLNTSVSTPGGFFTDLILDPQKLTALGDLQAVVHLVGVATPVTSPFFGTHMNGNNFMTITVAPGLEIASVDLNSAAGFADLKQPRISGVNGATPPIPELPSMLLLGSGLLVCTQVLRRKRKVAS